jgi:hypothetical protein
VRGETRRAAAGLPPVGVSALLHSNACAFPVLFQENDSSVLEGRLKSRSGFWPNIPRAAFEVGDGSNAPARSLGKSLSRPTKKAARRAALGGGDRHGWPSWEGFVFDATTTAQEVLEAREPRSRVPSGFPLEGMPDSAGTAYAVVGR